MKRIILLLAVVLVGGMVIGQSNKVVTAYNLIKPEYNELDKAKQAIDEAAVHPKTMVDPKTWVYRGWVYYKLYQTKDEKFKNLDPDPLKVAYESFIKAKDLDIKKKWEEELKFRFTQVSADFFNRGSSEFEQKKFKESLQSFETVIDISTLPILNMLDTGAVYNAALAADEAGMNEKALEYYWKTANYNYGGSEVFHYIAQIQLKEKDTTAAMKTYEQGIAKYPNQSANLYVAVINIFLDKKDLNSAFGYVEKALEKDPANQSLWRVYGDAWQNRGDSDKAVEAYKKMIEIRPEDFLGYYMVGYIYFNQGYEENEKANAIPLSNEVGYKEAIAKADEKFRQSQPFFEKAYSLKQDDGDVLKALKQLYYRFKDDAKLKEIQAKIDELK